MYNGSPSSNPNSQDESWFTATLRSRGTVFWWNTTRFGAVLLKSESCHSSVLNELVLAIMDDVLGLHCDWYQLNLSQRIRIHPGERQHVPHRAESLVNVMCALSNYTATPLSSVTHCGGANGSSAPCAGLILTYRLGWLKQAFLTYLRQVAAKLSKPIRDLLGYRIHRPNLGGNDGQDPAVPFGTESHTLAAVDAVAPAVALELQAHYQNRAAAVEGSSS